MDFRLRFFGFILPCCAALLLFGGGCVTTDTGSAAAANGMAVDRHGLVTGTGIDASDLLIACLDLQRGLMGLPDIAGAARPVRLRVEPVENDSRLPLNLAALDQALRAQLSSGLPGQCRIMDVAADAAAADYFITGKLQRLAPDRAGDDERLLFTLQLIDAQNSELMWVGLHELRHQTPAAAHPL